MPFLVSVWSGTWPVKMIWSAHPLALGTPVPVNAHGLRVVGGLPHRPLVGEVGRGVEAAHPDRERSREVRGRRRDRVVVVRHPGEEERDAVLHRGRAGRCHPDRALRAGRQRARDSCRCSRGTSAPRRRRRRRPSWSELPVGEYRTQLVVSFPPSVPWWLLTLAWIAPIGTFAASARSTTPRPEGVSIGLTNASANSAVTRARSPRAAWRECINTSASAGRTRDDPSDPQYGPATAG